MRTVACPPCTLTPSDDTSTLDAAIALSRATDFESDAVAQLAAAPAEAQDEASRRPAAPRKDGPWFGVMVPPRADAAPAVKVGAMGLAVVIDRALP